MSGRNALAISISSGEPTRTDWSWKVAQNAPTRECPHRPQERPPKISPEARSQKARIIKILSDTRGPIGLAIEPRRVPKPLIAAACNSSGLSRAHACADRSALLFYIRLYTSFSFSTFFLSLVINVSGLIHVRTWLGVHTGLHAFNL